MQRAQFSTKTMAGKGGVATAVIILSLYLEAKALPFVPKEILDQFPEHTLAITFAGPLAGVWNGLKYWWNRRK